MLLALALGTGVIVFELLAATGITFPGYMGALVMGAVLRNIVEATGQKYPDFEINTIGEVSLSLFLAMAMMGLELWVLADLAIPIIVILIAQVLFMFLFSYFIFLIYWEKIMIQPFRLQDLLAMLWVRLLMRWQICKQSQENTVLLQLHISQFRSAGHSQTSLTPLSLQHF